MHFSFPTVAFMAAALVPSIQANFDLYFVFGTTYSGIPYERWQVFEAEPTDCEHIRSLPAWDSSADVSGNKVGVRCRGGEQGIGCFDYDPPEEIRQLEMHFSNEPLYHFTLYRERNHYMYGTDGHAYGRCILFPHGDFDCGGETGGRGQRKFRCLTDITLHQLVAAAPSWVDNPAWETWDPFHG